MLLIILAVVVLAGCSGPLRSPTTATPGDMPASPPVSTFTAPPSGQVPRSNPISVRVTDGWSGAPVYGARLLDDSVTTISDVDGIADGLWQGVSPSGSCLAVDVTAVGFLQRRTCVQSSITLWPAANDAEVSAIREAAFPVRDQLRRIGQEGFDTGSGVTFDANLSNRSDVRGVWEEARNEIIAATDGKLSIPFVKSISDEGFVVSLGASSDACRHRWFTWSFDSAKFCWDYTPEYFVARIMVNSSAATDTAVALRALLYAYALKPHQMPGLMNINAPANALSAFERKTLRMMALRAGRTVVWPDRDQ